MMHYEFADSTDFAVIRNVEKEKYDSYLSVYGATYEKLIKATY